MATTIFTANDGVNGRELWRTDGTASGTFMFADLTPGSGSSFATSSGSVGVTNPFVSVPGHVFFTRNDGTHGTELWATDGTASGTGLVADIAPGGAGSSPVNLTSAGSKLYFSANDGSGGGAEPWVSDGTAAGTIRLAANGVLAPRDFTAFNGRVYFDANNGGSGSSAFARGQVWVTDGTAAGTTTLLASIMPQATAASVAFLANAGGGLVFAASDSSSGGGAVLGFSDGTSTGTTTFALQGADGGRVVPSNSFAVVGGLVYFGTQTATASGSSSIYQIWVSDGTQAGTHAVADAGTVPSLFSAGGKIYFTNYDTAHGAELWTVDTTGARLVSDLTPGTASSNPTNFFDYGGRIVFFASGGYGISDGTAAGTSYFDPAGTFPSSLEFNNTRFARPELGIAGNKLLLGLDDLAHGYELFGSDGTRSGTTLVDDINPAVDRTYPLPYFSTSFRIPYSSPNGLIFIGTDPLHGDEPWITDGTLAGTHLLADLTAGPAGTGSRVIGNTGSYNFGFQALANGEVFFDGFNLYRADDLALNNASLLYGFSANANSTIYNFLIPGGLTSYNGSAYFQASDATHSPRLWTTDGTVAGTHQVFDPASGTSGPINPTDISVAGSRLVFEAVPDSNFPFGPLWASDGTPVGTQKIRDGNFHKIGQLGQSLLLVGNDAITGGGTTTYGPSQIYVTDGTAVGTLPILTSLNNYGRFASQTQSIVGDRLVFDFNDGVHGDELWSTDGTATGTQLIADISTGSQSTEFSPLISDGLGHSLFTAGPNSSALTQLWTTDGTAAGTRMLNSSFPTTSFTFWHGNIYYSMSSSSVLYQADGTGSNAVQLGNLTVSTFLQSTDQLYFIASDAAGNGRELWTSDGTVAGTIRITDSYSSSSSLPQSFTALLSAAVELVPPPSVRLSNDTGVSASDTYTGDASLTIVPSQNGDTLAYTIDGNPAVSYDPASLSQGRHTVSVVEMDAAGNVSTATTLSFVLDTTAPSLAVSSVSGATNVVDGHVVSGTIDSADAALTVTIRDGTTVLGTAAVDAQGHFTFALPTDMADGTSHAYALTATATDAAGNLGASDSFAFALDYTPNQSLFGTLTHDVSSPGGQAYALYDALLSRAADAPGLEGWASALGHGESLHDVAISFLASDEFTAKYGGAYTTGSDDAFVQYLYHEALGRDSDTQGEAYWDALLAGGRLRADVTVQFALSAENQGQIAPALQVGVFVADPAASAVAHLYYGLLDRAPDAGGLQSFMDQVHKGVSLTSVAQSFLSSGEYAALHPGAPSDQQYVDSLYTHALGRSADVGGEQSWLNALSHNSTRADVAIGIAESQEASLHLVGKVEAGWHLA